MNRAQQVVLSAGILAVCALLLMPPWVHSGPLGGEVPNVRVLGRHSFIWRAPPLPEYASEPVKLVYSRGAWSTEIDYARLALEAIPVILVTGGLLILLRHKRKAA